MDEAAEATVVRGIWNTIHRSIADTVDNTTFAELRERLDRESSSYRMHI